MYNFNEDFWYNQLYTQYETDMINYDEPVLPSLEDLNFYDLMGDDYYPYLTKNSKNEINLLIEGYNNDLIIQQNNIHPAAVDSFAEFCKRYLASYNRLTNNNS